MENFKIGNTVKTEMKVWVSHYVNNSLPSIVLSDDEIAEEITSFGNLLEGWDYGEGVAPKQNVISNAKLVYFISKLQGFSAEPHPNPDGTITLILFYGEHFLDVDVSGDHRLLVRYELGKGKDYKVIWENRDVPFFELEYILIEIKAECQKSTLLETSTSKAIIARQKEDFKTTKYSNYTKEAYQFSAKNVQSVLPKMDCVAI